jgi:hypothetical protein
MTQHQGTIEWDGVVSLLYRVSVRITPRASHTGTHPHMKECCAHIVHWGVILTLTMHNNDTTPRHNGVGSMCGSHSIVPWCCVIIM